MQRYAAACFKKSATNCSQFLSGSHRCVSLQNALSQTIWHLACRLKQHSGQERRSCTQIQALKTKVHSIAASWRSQRRTTSLKTNLGAGSTMRLDPCSHDSHLPGGLPQPTAQTSALRHPEGQRTRLTTGSMQRSSVGGSVEAQSALSTCHCPAFT